MICCPLAVGAPTAWTSPRSGGRAVWTTTGLVGRRARTLEGLRRCAKRPSLLGSPPRHVKEAAETWRMQFLSGGGGGAPAGACSAPRAPVEPAPAPRARGATATVMHGARARPCYCRGFRECIRPAVQQSQPRKLVMSTGTRGYDTHSPQCSSRCRSATPRPSMLRRLRQSNTLDVRSKREHKTRTTVLTPQLEIGRKSCLPPCSLCSRQDGHAAPPQVVIASMSKTVAAPYAHAFVFSKNSSFFCEALTKFAAASRPPAKFRDLADLGPSFYMETMSMSPVRGPLPPPGASPPQRGGPCLDEGFAAPLGGASAMGGGVPLPHGRPGGGFGSPAGISSPPLQDQGICGPGGIAPNPGMSPRGVFFDPSQDQPMSPPSQQQQPQCIPGLNLAGPLSPPHNQAAAPAAAQIPSTDASSDQPHRSPSHRSPPQPTHHDDQDGGSSDDSHSALLNEKKVLPPNLPRRQRELFMRIQQQQRTAETTAAAEAADAAPNSGASPAAAAVDQAEGPAAAKPEPAKIASLLVGNDESSSDDDEDYDPLTAVLKKLQQAVSAFFQTLVGKGLVVVVRFDKSLLNVVRLRSGFGELVRREQFQRKHFSFVRSTTYFCTKALGANATVIDHTLGMLVCTARTKRNKMDARSSRWTAEIHPRQVLQQAALPRWPTPSPAQPSPLAVPSMAGLDIARMLNNLRQVPSEPQTNFWKQLFSGVSAATAAVAATSAAETMPAPCPPPPAVSRDPRRARAEAQLAKQTEQPPTSRDPRLRDKPPPRAQMRGGAIPESKLKSDPRLAKYVGQKLPEPVAAAPAILATPPAESGIEAGRRAAFACRVGSAQAAPPLSTGETHEWPRHLEQAPQQQPPPTESKPLIAELPKLTPPPLPAEVVPKSRSKESRCPRRQRRHRDSARRSPSRETVRNSRRPAAASPNPRTSQAEANSQARSEAAGAGGQPGKPRGNADGRKNRMDYASPLSTYESEGDRPSGYSSYQRRPAATAAVLPADAMPPPPPPPPKPAPQPLLPAAAAPSLISDDLLFQADQAMKSLKDVFKTKDPTASPFC
ncbi:hypothetical protein HPB48_025956 [Haemaphysalis longicornis]|uniref:Uncharacterized protein n=1 Tax=Haemaphysalis longicornis TaxID=44386 RepID=A0A9J6H8E8_HAELO|nr:hypothetical protein HPB48_025956 [Haemaphysalis longicornis]